MIIYSLTKGSEHALKLLALTGGNDTLLLIQPAREIRAEIHVQPAAEQKLEAELRLREQRHSMTLQTGDSANAQHLADWVEAIANGTLDTALAVPQRTESAPTQDEQAAFDAWYVTPEAFKAGDCDGWRGIAWAAWQARAALASAPAA